MAEGPGDEECLGICSLLHTYPCEESSETPSCPVKDIKEQEAGDRDEVRICRRGRRSLMSPACPRHSFRSESSWFLTKDWNALSVRLVPTYKPSCTMVSSSPQAPLLLQAPLCFLPFTLLHVSSYPTPSLATLTPFVSLSKDSGHLSCDGRKDADGDSEDEADRCSHDPELGR